jgi:hypothetical protein
MATVDEKMVGARVSKELEARIEKFRQQMAKRTPGLRPSLSDAVRTLIEAGLAAANGARP